MNEQLEAYKKHVKHKLQPPTIKTYTHNISQFCNSLNYTLKSLNTVEYKTIIKYIGEKRKEVSTSTLNTILQSLKSYFDYLAQTNQRVDNPARSIFLKDLKSRDIQTQDLFSVKELELLLKRKERYIVLKNRNLLIISLLIYQGLKTSEIKDLSINDVDFKEATIYIKERKTTNSRTLKLNGNQVVYLMNYLNFEREKLQKKESNILFLSKLGNAENGEGIQYLLQSSRHLFETKDNTKRHRKLNPTTIRQSVIFNLLNQGHDLRIVQVFAGHKTPTSTERYKQTHLEELKKQVLKFHPLQ